jgi:hypothetical protein
VPVIVSLGSPSAVITSAWVPDLPAGLSATVLAVQPGVYALNCTGCPGDPRHNAADASALTRFPVTVQPGEQEDLLVVLNADHLGTFSIEGFDVAWRSGGEEGTPAGDCRRCRG